MRINLNPFKDSAVIIKKGSCKKYMINVNGINCFFKVNFNRKEKPEYFKNQFKDNIVQLNGDIYRRSFFLIFFKKYWL